MTDAGFRHLSYQWSGGTEWMLVHEAKYDPQIIIIPPLFEELNLLRGFTVDFARALAARGIASWLPDLPGTGESLRELRDIGWEDWRGALHAAGEAVASHTGAAPFVASFRGGVLLSDAVEARGWWSFAPATGASLLRHLQRIQLISNIENDLEDHDNKRESSYFGGYELSLPMRDALRSAIVPPVNGPSRIVPAGSGTPLWRRAEPGRDPELSDLLAEDIAAWTASCAGR